MRFDEAYSGKVFIASRPDWKEADAILYGMPMDWTVSYRPGSRFYRENPRGVYRS